MNLLRKYIKIQQISQKQLAQRVGCTTTCINNLMMGKHTDIKISLLSRLCLVTGISMENLAADLLSAKQGIQGFGPHAKRGNKNEYH